MVPDFLPISVTEIVAERNIDLDCLEVEFVFGGDFDGFLSGQKKIGHCRVESLRILL